MLDFQIHIDVFAAYFGSYLAFFAFVYGVSHAISLLKDRFGF